MYQKRKKAWNAEKTWVMHWWGRLTSLAEVVAVEEEGDEHDENGGARQRDQHDRPHRQVVVVLVRLVFRVLL